jgi:uncharacterized protein
MRLQDIYIYPVKSLGGIRLDSWELEERGFKYDRRWLLIDKSGMFITQRKYPRLALLQVALSATGIHVYAKKNTRNYIEVPFSPAAEQLVPVTIWDDQTFGQLVDPFVSKWFSEKLEMDCDLVVMPESIQRKIDPKYAVNGESVSFADAMPYLIIGQASLDELNSRLADPVPMNRFRPNLVFSGGIPFEEDQWSSLKIGGAEFKITKPCARCVLTTIDQDTGKKGKEPLQTLAKYRNQNNKIMFGQNLLLLNGERIQVGDLVIGK